ncbi:hypothetical protein [Thermococcus sp.]|uniref:hypothetical protein n=1 Tax=Thermococcus sp. TaxID=35749 RepID=UPI00261531C1|nr:hypothetical protein [Thermococcus sp.]
MEIRLRNEEFREVKRHRKEIEARFRDLEGLERTLKELRLRILLEQKEKLEKRLEELEREYRELLEFERKALADKEFLMEFRKKLGEENRELTKRLGEGK